MKPSCESLGREFTRRCVRGFTAFILLLPTISIGQINPNPSKPSTTTTPKSTGSAATATIKVTSNAPCRFYVDSELKGTIVDDRPLKLSLRPGDYEFKAVSTTSHLDVKQDTHSVTKEQVGTEVRYLMDLRSVIALRVASENVKREEEAKRRSDEATAEAWRNAGEVALADLKRTMLHVQGGSFIMGCTAEQEGDCDESERPSHRVTLKSFHLGKFEVQQVLWALIMGENSSPHVCEQCPVTSVSWEEAQEFLDKLNARTGERYRLPSEAEWEFAARGGNKSKGTKYAGNHDLNIVGWYKGPVHPAGQKAPNELGLYDMSGNAMEWCEDWYDEKYYGQSPENSPTGPVSGEDRVIRGNTWATSSWGCRVSFRNLGDPDGHYIYGGLRLAHSE